jgi:phosphatidylethanolamine/phosphatidyl-N-methylethanolamine N-methyltransferase
VLDVGTGTGLSLPYFRPDLSITGIDISENQLARARQRARRKKLKNIAALSVMDVSDMQMADGQFDSVLGIFAMSVAPDPAAVLAEIARVTRFGGRVYLFNHSWPSAPACKVGFHSDFCHS